MSALYTALKVVYLYCVSSNIVTMVSMFESPGYLMISDII